MEEHARTKFVNGAVLHGSGSAARKHEAYMFNMAARSTHTRTNVNRPFPSGLIGRAADGHSSDVHDLEPAFFEGPNFIGILKPFQDCFEWHHGSRTSDPPQTT